MKTLNDKSVLILGLGETGLSMVRWLACKGADLRVADSRAEPPGLDEVATLVADEQIFCGPFDDSLLLGIDMIAISPGIPLSEPLVCAALARGIPVAGDIELFAQQLATRNIQPAVLAITGSNGKTTVTSLVAHLCRAAGVDAVAAGNISPAVLDVVMQRGEKQPEVWVLELSSFQLDTTVNLKADAAAVLNISEDHLDRHAGMEGYAAAKKRIFAGCGVQVLNRDDVHSLAMREADSACVTFGLSLPECETDFGIATDADEIWLVQGNKRLIRASELQLAGMHNVANALAALALCSTIGLHMPQLLVSLRSFKGLPHRMERVKALNGVTFYDDSKGTNVGATVAALEGLGCQPVLIAGGVGKGQDFSPLRSAVARHARAVVLIGRDAQLIAAALQGCNVPVLLAADMQEAVRLAAGQALPGDAVLMSPACASFDMYRNYVHRAEDFINAVHRLDREGAWPL